MQQEKKIAGPVMQQEKKISPIEAQPVSGGSAQPAQELEAVEVVHTLDNQKQEMLFDSHDALSESVSSYTQSMKSVADSMELPTTYQILKRAEEKREPPNKEGCLQDGLYKGWTPQQYTSEELKDAKGRTKGQGKFVMPMEWRAYEFQQREAQQQFREDSKIIK